MSNQPSYFAIIPAHVRYCKELEPCARLLYGEITALTSKEGYCWASNEYFSDLYDVDIRTIKRWVSSLHELGFIKVETKKNGLKWERKIWIQNMFTKGQKCPDDFDRDENAPTDDFQRRDKNVPIEGTKMPPYKDMSINKTTTITTETPKAVVVFSSLNNLSLSDHLKATLSSLHTEDAVNLAVKRCLAWKGRVNDEAGILTCLKKAATWTDTVSKEDRVVSNQEYLKSLRNLDGKKINFSVIGIGNTYIEFVAGPKCVNFSIDDVNFKKSVEDHMEYLRKLNKGEPCF